MKNMIPINGGLSCIYVNQLQATILILSCELVTTIFTWLSAMATISHVLNFIVATIQGDSH